MRLLDGVTGTISIHGAAFGHTGIEELDIPTTVSEIGNYAFNACENLKKVTFRGQTKLLGTPFPNENALEELVIADKAVITAADKNGNSNNSRPFGANTLKSLKKLELLGEFKDVDSSATTTTKNEGLWGATFRANTELTDVTVSGSNMQYVSHAAFPAIKTLNVVGGNATAKFMCTSHETNNTLENISIDVDTYSGVKEAFNGATALKTFVLKANTVTLGEYEFGRDNSLKAIDFSQCGNVTYGNSCFGVGENAATNAVVYVKDSSTAPSNTPCAVLVVNGGNVDLTKEGFDSVSKPGYATRWYTDSACTNALTAEEVKAGPQIGKTYYAAYKTLHTVTFDDGVNNSTVKVADGETVAKPETDPKKDGNKFDGWYADKNCTAGNEFKFADNENANTITADTTVYAKWTPYNTKVDADVKANADPASKTVEITVNVEANLTELDGATATLNFTDANGHDDSKNVAEVKVNGKTVNQNADGKYTASLNDLMNTGKGADAVMLADVDEIVPSITVNGTAILTVTYKNPGKHRVEIVLNAANGDVICKKPVTVEIAPEPGTLNLTGCTAKLEDGTPVENGAKVPVGAKVTVTFDKDANSDLVLNGWNVTPDTLTDTNDKLVKDITADTFTFKMPETDKGVTIEALTKAKAAAPAEDDSMDAAAVVTGVVLGTGTAILAYHIGTEVYAEQVLGKGVAIPRTREEVALKAWELAGKPAVELNGEPLSEAAQAEKWAVESGLMQNVDGSFNGSKKMSKLKALRTLDAAKKLG